MQGHVEAILFDTETTGLNEPQVIQAAYLNLHGIEPEQILEASQGTNEYFKPTKPIEFGALSTHHIFAEDLQDYPVWEYASHMPSCDYLVGHQIDFDWTVIGKPAIKRICTLAMARRLWPDLDSHKLTSCTYFLFGKRYKDKIQGAHNAYEDVQLNFLLLESILEELGRREVVIASWEDLWVFSEAARIPMIMTFGKHKGKHVRDVDWGYVNWYRKQPDPDEYMLKAFDLYCGR